MTFIRPTGGTIPSVWTLDSGITDANPGSRKFRFNNATQASATFLYVDDTAAGGGDLSNILLQLDAGDRIYVQENKDSLNYHVFAINGPAVDATTYVKLPGTVVVSGSDLSNNRKAVFVMSFSGP